MKKLSVKFPHIYRNGLFFVLLISWTTGITFYILNRWITIEGDFGLEKHPWQFTVLQVHGAAAFLMIMAFGSVIAAHIPASWKLNRLRIIGITLTSILSLQIMSAYLLYYLSNETIRDWVANIHAALGVTLPLVLIAHIMIGIKTRKNRKTNIKL